MWGFVIQILKKKIELKLRFIAAETSRNLLQASSGIM
jgi:hypothetical protein